MANFLLIGPKKRVVQFHGPISAAAVNKCLRLGEHLMGLIGHHEGELTPDQALEMLANRQNLFLPGPPAPVISLGQLGIPIIDDPRLPFEMMRDELTVGLFARFVDPNTIIGDGAEALKHCLRGAPENALTHLSALDEAVFIKEVKAQTGMALRPMTATEFDSLPDDVKAQMTGNNWFWTSEPVSPGGRALLLRHLVNTNLNFEFPDKRYGNITSRLVRSR